MPFFDPDQPVLRSKQAALDVQDLEGLLDVNWRIANWTLFSSHYTRIDQIFLLWALLAAVIFVTAQFLPISWGIQAVCWSIVTILGTGAMIAWSWYWTGVEQLRWLIWSWLALLVVGLALTDWGIFAAQPLLMAHLCQLWLGLNAIGYCITGLGLQSRSLNLVGIAHLLGGVAVSYTPGWQFLLTGMIIALSSLMLGEYQWDMRPPSQFAHLSEHQLQFNQQQHLRRQSLLCPETL
jgi:hypothetical protein